MSNASLKEQLEAVASQLSNGKLAKERKPNFKKKPAIPGNKINKANKPHKVQPPKPKWLEEALYGVELLKAHFPQCFKSPSEVKPIKKGIKQDLVKFLSSIETIAIADKACMVKTLAYYVNTAAYHKSITEGAIRIDLEGNPAGIVSVEEAKYSIERQQAKLQARRTTPSPLQSKVKDDEVTT